MSIIDLRAATAIMSLRQEQARKEAESRALRSQAEGSNQSWFAQHGSWLLAQAGRLLVFWGERLEAYDPRHIRPAESTLGSN
jgi:hypothetical protein